MQIKISKIEKLNALSHAVGIVLAFVSFGALTHKVLVHQQAILGSEHLCYFTFSCSALLLYIASTIYHAWPNTPFKQRLRVLDHAAIYLLIAGSYTPFLGITLASSIGHTYLYIIWSIALFGIIFKLFFTGRFSKLSTILYVGMGWIVVFVSRSLFAELPTESTLWLVAGGLSYTIGAIFYSIKKLTYGHLIFHVFVLLGTLFHLFSIYLL